MSHRVEPAQSLTASLSRRDMCAIATGVATFVTIAVAFRLVGFDALQGEVGKYWDWSLTWWSELSSSHLPGWPIVIWMARTLSFGLLPDLVLIQGLTLTLWIASARYVSLLVRDVCENADGYGVALFGLFPFVGVTQAVYPIADSAATTALVAALWYYRQRQWSRFTAAVAVGLVLHKVLWPFMLLLSVLGLLGRGLSPVKFLLSGVPIIMYWGSGFARLGDPLWILRANISIELTSQSSLPVLDGVLGTILSGGIRGITKGGLLILLLVAAVWCLVTYFRRREYDLAALGFVILLLLIVLNQHEVWAAVRFARILAVPLSGLLCFSASLRSVAGTRWAFPAVLMGGVVSQLIFAAYMYRFLAV